MILNEVIKPTIVKTLADVACYANRALGAVLRIEDISEALSRIPDFETYLHLRLQINVQSSQRRLQDIISPDTKAYMIAQMAKSTRLLQQLELPRDKRDPLAQIEIDMHRRYFKQMKSGW